MKNETTPRARAALTLCSLLLGTAACVESIEVPLVPAQATVSYGEKLFLVDTTPGARPSGDRCTQLGSDTATSADQLVGIDPDVPFNCYVKLQPTAPNLERELKVDVVEVTNELFQLCVDSGACEGPDPSKSSPSQVCQVAEEFDVCPVVEVPQLEAGNFCQWIGRRLPTSLEHVVIRQALLTDSQDPTAIPGYVHGDDEPASCDDAILGTAGCMASKPRAVLDDGDEPVGAAPRDIIDAQDGQIFDVVGNLAEWTSDLFPARRGNGNDLPWFCVAGLTRTSTSPFSMSNPPTCPATATCVWGRYRLSEDDPIAEWPVCITNANGRFNGTIGAVYGGSHNDDSPAAEAVGIYGRKIETDPQALSDTSRARGYGFRCVGDRASGTVSGEGTIELEDFDDVFEIVNP